MSSPRGIPLSGSRLLVTGGGSGIGRLMALGAARRGARGVVLWDLSREAAEAVADEIRTAGSTATVMTVDVSDRAAVAEAARAAGQTDYAGSKFAAVGFTEALRAELRQQDSGVTTLLVAPFYIATGMFQGVTTRFPRLLPIVDPDDVATRVLDAIESGREQLIMPLMASLVSAGRILPVRLFDRAMDFYGVNRSMAGFTGRGARPYRDLPA